MSKWIFIDGEQGGSGIDLDDIAAFHVDKQHVMQLVTRGGASIPVVDKSLAEKIATTLKARDPARIARTLSGVDEPPSFDKP